MNENIHYFEDLLLMVPAVCDYCTQKIARVS